MESQHLNRRIATLKYICEKEINIKKIPGYKSIFNSPSIPERYWATKALGTSTGSETHALLLKLLNDPDFNVVCMALDSLGRRGYIRDVTHVLNKINTSQNWYEQWYGYHALKRLGWKQKPSR